jgi:hypothetical protein
MTKLNKNFWKERYDTNTIGWDCGQITTPLKTYIDQIENKSLKILIPGAGNSYEAEYLHNKGFTNVHVIDLVKHPLDNLSNRVPNFPKTNLIQGNFFELDDTFDLIIEQTFFCALNPSLRADYVKKMQSLLNKNGKIVGLLFNFQLTEDGPPFGGSKKEYLERFSQDFNIITLDTCHNSISPRQDRELFFIFERK